ncbi:hypothetical protein CMI42_05795 [Candidatus Pacearchaeota archaeon]|nr:hypothetical protein [Candidatus Pacearchaeota archaeon]
MSEDSITIKKDTLWKITTFIFAGLFILTLVLNNGFGDGVNNEGNVNPPTVAPPTTGNIKVQIDDTDPILGDEKAEITIVEFSDFQCPFCQKAADGAIADFKNSDYFKNGDVRLAFKHFPLNRIHPQAQKAAEASESANRQGKFWEMHDIIFANQRQLDDASLKSYASQIGLNTAEFNKCLDNGEATNKVNNDLKQATAAGGRGTPYFVLVNKKGETAAVSGAQPWVNFEAAIKSLQ